MSYYMRRGMITAWIEDAWQENVEMPFIRERPTFRQSEMALVPSGKSVIYEEP